MSKELFVTKTSLWFLAVFSDCSTLDSVYTRSSEYGSPDGDTTNLDSGDKRSGALGVAGGDATPTLEVQESVFYQMPELVEIVIIIALDLAVLLGSNDHAHAY
jgi:hypothetical protein